MAPKSWHSLCYGPSAGGYMKNTIIILMTFFTLQAQAGSKAWDVIGAIIGAVAGSGSSNSSSNSSSGRPGRYEPAQERLQVTCRASDTGWEEHGSHRDCQSCQAKHGKCIETCKTEFYRCKAEGRDYRGYTMSVEGTGATRYSAERNAIYRCDRDNSDCRVLSCASDSETVSSRRCR